jgi:hypothetical protein
VRRARACHVPAVRIAKLYAHAGDHGAALRWLDEAFARRENPLVHLAVARDWDGLREDPRFHDLLRRMKLPLC